MIRHLVREDDILDETFRKQVLSEITGPENINRKNRDLRRYEVYKDEIKKWVIEALVKENLKPSTLEQMRNRAANVSICRKVINKLARCYAGGVQRSATVDLDQKKLDFYVKDLEFDAKMKKANRYVELFKNTMVQVVPVLSDSETEADQKKYDLHMRNFAPWQYDVLPDYNNHECAKVVILTDFIERNNFLRTISGDGALISTSTLVPEFAQGDRRDQAIANEPEDQGYNKRVFIWWSDKYHFTTDRHGQILPEMSPEKNLNPIGLKPFVNIAEGQDGEFWAKGGDDLVDGSILINLLLTDMFSIAYIQGWGQLVITGKNIKQQIEGGPHTALVMDYNDGDPEPKVNFASANPPLSAWMQMVEQYMALLLSTNELSPASVSSKLQSSVNSAPSGIAALIDSSEATNNLEEKQKRFQDWEREIWDVVMAWQNKLSDAQALCEDEQQLGKFNEQTEVVTKFLAIKPVITETDKLNGIALKKQLGLITQLDAIREENPDLSEEQAEEKLAEILAEKLSRAGSLFSQALNNQNQGQPQANPQAGATQGGMDMMPEDEMDPLADEQKLKAQLKAIEDAKLGAEQVNA